MFDLCTLLLAVLLRATNNLELLQTTCFDCDQVTHVHSKLQEFIMHLHFIDTDCSAADAAQL